MTLAFARQCHDDLDVMRAAVRTAMGAPRWLSAAARARSEAVVVLETGNPTTAYNRLVFTPAQPQPDPAKLSSQQSNPESCGSVGLDLLISDQ